MIKGTKVRAIRPAVRATSIVVDACARSIGYQIESYPINVAVTLKAPRSVGRSPCLAGVE